MKNQFGRSMLEMLGVLALIGVLSLVGLAIYDYLMDKYRANETMHDVVFRGVNVPFSDTQYLENAQNPDHVWNFHDLPEDGRRGRIAEYEFETKSSDVGGFAYMVTVSNVTPRVCQMMLRMEAEDIGLIKVTKPDGSEEVFDFDNPDFSICDDLEATLSLFIKSAHAQVAGNLRMTFYFDEGIVWRDVCLDDQDCGVCHKCDEDVCAPRFECPDGQESISRDAALGLDAGSIEACCVDEGVHCNEGEDRPCHDCDEDTGKYIFEGCEDGYRRADDADIERGECCQPICEDGEVFIAGDNYDVNDDVGINDYVCCPMAIYDAQTNTCLCDDDLRFEDEDGNIDCCFPMVQGEEQIDRVVVDDVCCVASQVITGECCAGGTFPSRDIDGNEVCCETGKFIEEQGLCCTGDDNAIIDGECCPTWRQYNENTSCCPEKQHLPKGSSATLYLPGKGAGDTKCCPDGTVPVATKTGGDNRYCCPLGAYYDTVNHECVQPCPTCQAWSAEKGECVALCATGEICIADPLCQSVDGAICVPNEWNYDKKDMNMIVGIYNGLKFYLPPLYDGKGNLCTKADINDGAKDCMPAENARVSFNTAVQICHGLRMHMATVYEACNKTTQVDDGHNCDNLRGQFPQYNTRSGGDLWAFRTGDDDICECLRITNTCGNNHFTYCDNKYYPLCTEGISCSQAGELPNFILNACVGCETKAGIYTNPDASDKCNPKRWRSTDNYSYLCTSELFDTAVRDYCIGLCPLGSRLFVADEDGSASGVCYSCSDPNKIKATTDECLACHNRAIDDDGFCVIIPEGYYRGADEEVGRLLMCPIGYTTSKDTGFVGLGSCQRCDEFENGHPTCYPPIEEYPDMKIPGGGDNRHNVFVADEDSEDSYILETLRENYFRGEHFTDLDLVVRDGLYYVETDVTDSSTCSFGPYYRLENCEAGTWASDLGEECTPCGAGRGIPAFDADLGFGFDYGIHPYAEKCPSCPENYYCTEGGSVEACPFGQWSNEGATTCSECAAGTFVARHYDTETGIWTDEADNGTEVGAGLVPLDGGQCIECPDGFACENGISPTKCAGGDVSTDDKTACEPIVCTEYEYWQVNSDGLTECVPCGESDPVSDGNNGCTTCANVYWDRPYWDGDSCEPCPAETPAWKDGSCTTCGENETWSPSQNSCQWCDDGLFWDEAQGTCVMDDGCAKFGLLWTENGCMTCLEMNPDCADIWTGLCAWNGGNCVSCSEFCGWGNFNPEEVEFDGADGILHRTVNCNCDGNGG